MEIDKARLFSALAPSKGEPMPFLGPPVVAHAPILSGRMGDQKEHRSRFLDTCPCCQPSISQQKGLKVKPCAAFQLFGSGVASGSKAPHISASLFDRFPGEFVNGSPSGCSLSPMSPFVSQTGRHKTCWFSAGNAGMVCL